jgi:hypothetical protein
MEIRYRVFQMAEIAFRSNCIPDPLLESLDVWKPAISLPAPDKLVF